MSTIGRRSVLCSTIGLAAGEILACPYIANAATTTATAWSVQGFAQEEDVAFKQAVSEYEKVSRETIVYSIVPYAPLRQKIVSAMSGGGVPDLIPCTPAEANVLF